MQMKLLHRGFSYHMYEVTLHPREREWSHSKIITYVDRRGHLPEDVWEKIQAGELHPGHFGGSVESTSDPSIFIVKVYTD